jgi:hypothetical protein
MLPEKWPGELPWFLCPATEEFRQEKIILSTG